MALNRNKAFYLVGNAEWTLGDQSWLINTLENHLRGSNNVITYSKSRYGKGRTVDRVRRTRPVEGNKQHWNKIIKKIIPKEVAKMLRWSRSTEWFFPSLRSVRGFSPDITGSLKSKGLSWRSFNIFQAWRCLHLQR